MIELNLLPDVKKEFIRAQRTRNKVITYSFFAMIGAGGAVVAFAFYVFAVQTVHMVYLSDQIRQKSDQLESVNDLGKYLTIQNQLANLDSLHESKNIYSRAMDYLVKLNPRDPNGVLLSDLTVSNEDKSITFKGTTPTFESFNIFKDTLVNAELTYRQPSGEVPQGGQAPQSTPVAEKLFDDVVIETSSLSRESGEGQIQFGVRVTYNAKAFDAKLQNVAIRVPNIETTPSVQQAPRPIFNDRAEEQE